MKDSKYYKRKVLANKKDTTNNVWLTKLLISVIVLLMMLIVTNFSENLKEEVKKRFLENNINFNKMNEIYNKYIGDVQKDSEEVALVSGEVNPYYDEEQNGSYIIEVGASSPVSFYRSGLIVYYGNKDEYNNTVIVQGNDGVDLWYSNVELKNYSLYDYVSEGDILGVSLEENIVLTIMKDGKKLTYEEYFK